jgi:hypothetical protein
MNFDLESTGIFIMSIDDIDLLEKIERFGSEV